MPGHCRLRNLRGSDFFQSIPQILGLGVWVVWKLSLLKQLFVVEKAVLSCWDKWLLLKQMAITKKDPHSSFCFLCLFFFQGHLKAVIQLLATSKDQT